MSSVPLPILFIMLVFFTMWMILRRFHRHESAKRALPERASYLLTHGLADPSCHACGADALKEEGLSHGKDARRIVSCAKCSALLYHFDRPLAPEGEDPDEGDGAGHADPHAQRDSA